MLRGYPESYKSKTFGYTATFCILIYALINIFKDFVMKSQCIWKIHLGNIIILALYKMKNQIKDLSHCTFVWSIMLSKRSQYIVLTDC